MREIKFRAWDSRAERMLGTVLAWTHKTSTSVMLNWGHFEVPYSPGRNWKKDGYGNHYSDDGSVTAMQYTGLKDKNGVEIYEGDIVKILYTDWPSQSPEQNGRYKMSLEQYMDSIALTMVVIWSVQGFYVSNEVGGYAESMEPGRHGYIEVIGNIYENPSPLNPKED